MHTGPTASTYFSDPDGDALVYSFTATDGGAPATLGWLSIDPVTGALSGNPPGAANGKTYAITVTAMDPGGLSVSDTFSWTFNSSPDPLPAAGSLDMTLGTDSGANGNDNITSNGLPQLTFSGGADLVPTLTGPDGTVLTPGQHYRTDFDAVTQIHTVVLLDAQPGGSANTFGSFTGSTPTGNPLATADGTYEITVSNGVSSVVAGTFVIDTTAPAAPSVVLQTNDTDHPMLTGNVGNGPLPAGETLTVTFNGAVYTNVSVDGSGNWTVDTNTPPNSGALGALVAGEAYDVTAVVTDAAGNTSADQTGGEFRKTAPPTKSGEGLFEYTVPGGTFAGGGGGGGGPLTYTAGTAPAGGGAGAPTPLPGWLVFDPGTQTFSGNPPDRATSPLVVRVTATDGAGKTSYTDLTFTFTNTNDAPVITNVQAEPWGAAMGGATKLPSVRFRPVPRIRCRVWPAATSRPCAVMAKAMASRTARKGPLLRPASSRRIRR